MPRAPAFSVRLPWQPPVVLIRTIDSILTKWIASMTQQKKTRSLEGGSDEAARLFPQQRVLPGPYSLEPEGFERRSPAASSAQGRAARPRLPDDQSAGAG